MERAAYYAHSAPDRERWEPLAEHLALVAGSAARFASVLGAENEARAAGLLHDLGKYSEIFTRRLANLEKGLDHWSIGAWAALNRYKTNGLALGLAIEGHHIGLQRGDQESLKALDPKRLPVSRVERNAQRALSRRETDVVLPGRKEREA